MLDMILLKDVVRVWKRLINTDPSFSIHVYSLKCAKDMEIDENRFCKNGKANMLVINVCPNQTPQRNLVVIKARER